MARRATPVKITVPSNERLSLMPYAELFETILIPMVQDLTEDELWNFKAQNRLYRAILDSLALRYDGTHRALIYYGLLLCCYFCNQEIAAQQRPQGFSALETIAKAKLLTKLTFAKDHLYKRAIFSCG